MSIEGTIARLKAQLKMSGNASEALAHVQVTTAPTDYPELLRRLKSLPDIFRLATGVTLARSPSELMHWRRLPMAIDDRVSMSWHASVLRQFTKPISQFLTHERQFDRAVLNKEWGVALAILDQIEAEVGFSLWGLNNRFVVLERHSGVEAQKSFLRSLQELPDLSKELGLTLTLFSMQAEETVSADAYYQDISKQLEPQMGEYTSVEYLIYQLAFFGPFRFTHPHDLLNFEAANSIVDRFLSFIRIGQLLYADKGLVKYASHFKAALKNLGASIADPRLDWLRAVYGISATELRASFDPLQLGAFDLYTNGRYAEALEQIDALRMASDVDAEYEELSGRCIARLSPAEGSVNSRLGQSHARVLEDRESAPSAMAALRKEVLCFSRSKRAALVHTFLVAQSSSALSVVPVKFDRFSELSGLATNPRAILHAANASKLVRERVVPNFKRSPSFALAGLAEGKAVDPYSRPELVSVPKSRIAKYLALRAMGRNECESAIQNLEQLEIEGDRIDRLDAQEAIVACYLKLGRVVDASVKLANAVVLNGLSTRRLPLDELCDEIERLQLTLPTENLPIEIPNVFGILSAYRRKGREYRMGTLCEDFLGSVGLQRPSELIGRADRFDEQQLTFFFSRVCILPALDSSPAYNTQREIEDERVALLQWLIAKDPDRRATYAGEIAEITRKQKLAQAMKSVERSKVSVNIAGVKSLIPKDAEEAYRRYRSLPAYSVAQLNDILLQIVDHRQKARDQLVVVLPRSERSVALAKVYEIVKTPFVFSNDFGLDAYLSVGIRHNTLQGQIRACFERNKLITPRSESGAYTRNDYWIERLGGVGDELISTRIDAAYQEFSKAVDAGIAALRNELIQVRTEKRPIGLFDFRLSDAECGTLDKKLDSAESFSQAIDILLGQLWQKTDLSLANTRQYLQTEFRSLLDSALDDLVKALWNAGAHNLGEAEASITTARTEFHDELVTVSRWFTRGDASAAEDFDIWFAVDMALEMVNRCSAHKALRIERSGDAASRVSGEKLNALVNLFYIIFDNALEYGELRAGHVDLQLHIDAERPTLSIRAENAIDRNRDMTGVEEHLAAIRLEVGSQDTSERVRGEGGTGLVKIARIGKVDLGARCQLSFGLTGEREFQVKVSLLQEGLWA